jgi:hypothetical protein
MESSSPEDVACHQPCPVGIVLVKSLLTVPCWTQFETKLYSPLCKNTFGDLCESGNPLMAEKYKNLKIYDKNTVELDTIAYGASGR